jgi:ABC-2 type transport system ATP-binding protein
VRRVIELRNLRKEYGNLVAVEGLQLSIPAGEIYGLIGPNGAGKTTTIRMACGLLTPTEGKALIDGIDVTAEPERAQQTIGFLSDFFGVYEDLKVWEYLEYFGRAYKMPQDGLAQRIEEVIGEIHLEVKRDAFIRGLSRGMKQRLGIGRALIHRPKLLILDEPASGLDPKSRLDLRNLLRGLRDRGATILISSHILTELEGFCTSIGIMEKGRLVRSGRIEEIMARANASHEIRMTWLGDGGAGVEQQLANSAHASNIRVTAGGAEFTSSGSDEDLAAVLASLVSAGVRVTSFGEVRQTVEDLYMSLSTHEVT